MVAPDRQSESRLGPHRLHYTAGNGDGQQALSGNSMLSSPIVIGPSNKVAQNQPNEFEAYRFEKDNIPDLVRLARRHRTPPAEFLPIIETLNRQTAGSFANFQSLHIQCHDENSEPSPKCIRLVRDLLLASVDKRLQNIYREHFQQIHHLPMPYMNKKSSSLTRLGTTWQPS
jgi:hypothetical protein